MNIDRVRRYAIFPLVLLLASFVVWEQFDPSFLLAQWGAIGSAVLLFFLLIAGKVSSKRNRS